MMTHQNGMWYSSLLSLPGVVHGYSTRARGDARVRTNAEAIVRHLAGRTVPIVRAAQVHADVVEIVENATPDAVFGADGLATRTGNIMLEVRVADCVPMLYFDPVARVVAAVHAGWKGTVAHIATHAVARMHELGASPQNILVSIGPHIGACCYTVPEERARQFMTGFGDASPVVSQEHGVWHLDIGQANRADLLDAGVLPAHVDAPIVCTSCQSDVFYSYRKDRKETFGEIIGVIGLAT